MYDEQNCLTCVHMFLSDMYIYYIVYTMIYIYTYLIKIVIHYSAGSN